MLKQKRRREERQEEVGGGEAHNSNLSPLAPCSSLLKRADFSMAHTWEKMIKTIAHVWQKSNFHLEKYLNQELGAFSVLVNNGLDYMESRLHKAYGSIYHFPD
jgi:hypothetical protein